MLSRVSRGLRIPRAAAASLPLLTRCSPSTLFCASSFFSSSSSSSSSATSSAPTMKAPSTLLNVQTDASCNVSDAILSRMNRGLHRTSNHPLALLRSRIEQCFPGFNVFCDLPPVVSAENNFDRLLIPKDHVSRAPTDTYYLNQHTVLRTHTSAHQYDLLKARRDPFLVIGDVYRRDAIDRTHYPVFHQCEGVKVFPPGTPVAEVEKDLKMQLERLCRSLFGAEAEMRWVDAYFPFTEPSFELEVFFDGKWLECLGCGVIHRDVLKNAGRGNEVGWAFGLGLERLAMVLFGIPDIRLFWSSDARFLKQFENASAHSTKFEAFSKYPVCYKDISFWVPREGAWNDNDFFESVRNTCGDLVESVECIDEFVHPKTGRTSKCFRINYCAVDRTLTNEEVDALQVRVRDGTVAQFGVELR